MYKSILLCLGILITIAGLSNGVTAEISKETLEKEHRSRYYINYAGYLIDVGKYLEALESYEAAEEVTTISKTKVDALLAKATLLFSFLDAPEQALEIYRRLHEDYPEAAEIARYREGMLLFDLNRFKETQTALESYLKTYPTGRFRFQTETLLEKISTDYPRVTSEDKATTPKPPPGRITSDIEVNTMKPKEAPPLPAPVSSAPEVVALIPDIPEVTTPKSSAAETAEEKTNAAEPPAQKTHAPGISNDKHGVSDEKPAITSAGPKAETVKADSSETDTQKASGPEAPGGKPDSVSESSAVKVAVEIPGKPVAPAPKAAAPKIAGEPKQHKLSAALSKTPKPGPAMNTKRPKVRVRMCQTTRQARIQGSDICVPGMGCKDRYVLSLKNGKIQINGARAKDKTVTFSSDNPMRVVSGKKNKKVRGKLKAMVRKGKLMVINTLDIEDYLLSVVPSENPASWPVETLKAQAVAARTYAYYQREHRKTWAYDLVDYAGDQAYGGMDKEHKRSTTAVNATAGEILTHKNRPILAMYSANSGGHTADAQAIFNLHKPYLTAKQDPASLKGRMAHWTRKFSVSKVVTALGKIRIDAKGLKAIEAHKRGPSGRIVKVRLVLQKGKTKILRNRTTLRRALNLPEILHKIRLDGDTFIFEGHGWGHGVGYSQWGSAHLGKTKKYKEILAFYYGTAKMKKCW